MTRIPHGRGARLALVAAAIALPALVPGAARAASCAPAATSNPFAAFGDAADYSLLPGGDFESGAADWELTGAAVEDGNQPQTLANGATGEQSLSIDARGRAVSPAFCVGVEHPSFRFFAKREGGSWGTLAVRVRWTGTNGRTNETTLGSVDGSRSTWALTAPVQLATALPLYGKGQSLSAQLVFDPEDWGGDWRIDDVYVDPRMR